MMCMLCYDRTEDTVINFALDEHRRMCSDCAPWLNKMMHRAQDICAQAGFDPVIQCTRMTNEFDGQSIPTWMGFIRYAMRE